jgi:hypothetical protein
LRGWFSGDMLSGVVSLVWRPFAKDEEDVPAVVLRRSEVADDEAAGGIGYGNSVSGGTRLGMMAWHSWSSIAAIERGHCQ